jgi:hypothetical protein
MEMLEHDKPLSKVGKQKVAAVGDRQRAMARTLVCERAAARGLRPAGVRSALDHARAAAGEVLATERA